MPEEVIKRLKDLKRLIEKTEDKRDLFAQIFEKIIIFRNHHKFSKKICRHITIDFIQK